MLTLAYVTSAKDVGKSNPIKTEDTAADFSAAVLIFNSLFHTLRQLDQRILRHWRNLAEDFYEEGFFAAEADDVIVEVEEIREGNVQRGADEVQRVDVWDLDAEDDIGKLGFGDAGFFCQGSYRQLGLHPQVIDARGDTFDYGRDISFIHFYNSFLFNMAI